MKTLKNKLPNRNIPTWKVVLGLAAATLTYSLVAYYTRETPKPAYPCVTIPKDANFEGTQLPGIYLDETENGKLLSAGDFQYQTGLCNEANPPKKGEISVPDVDGGGIDDPLKLSGTYHINK